MDALIKSTRLIIQYWPDALWPLITAAKEQTRSLVWIERRRKRRRKEEEEEEEEEEEQEEEMEEDNKCLMQITPLPFIAMQNSRLLDHLSLLHSSDVSSHQ
ncbi:hypothetical protein E2C01_027336 [Portunus trituberculatus]|uniref:Uncharacterized protein n=1 Tax=Portunus trituberculatus TaxID=210409 RepID=A0A5B7ELA0_PORTR|nr:hypothetical protein [Portunus trituberculatus]